MRRPNRGDLPAEVWVLAAIAFAIAIGYGIVVPAIPLFARSFGVSNTAAGAVVSAFAFARLLTGPVAGPLVDRLGERLVLVVGLLIVAASSALAGVAGSFWQLVLMRGVGGFGSAMFSVSSGALLVRIVGPSLRGRATSTYQSGFLIGGVTGPAVGGLVTGISIRLPFFLYAGTLLVAAFIAAAFLTRAHLTADGLGSGSTVVPPLGEAFADPRYRAALVSNLATGWTLFGLRSALVPLFVVEGLHAGPSVTGLGLLLGALAQGLMLVPAGRLSDGVVSGALRGRIGGRRDAILLGSVVCAVAWTGLALVSSEPLFLVAMVLTGIGGAFLGTGSAATIGDVAAGRPAGRLVAFGGMASDTGTIIGPLAAGWLADNLGFGAGFAMGTVVMIAAIAVTARMPVGVPARNR